MHFNHPTVFWALAALVPLILLELRGTLAAGRALERLVGTRTPHALLEQRRPGERQLGALLRLSALAILTVGAAGPEWGREVVRRQATGSDVVMVLDCSASMDTRDVLPSRLEEGRREALGVLERLEGSRVAVVAFAGDAIRLCPLTLDLAAARLSLEALGSGAVSEPGTDLGKALRLASRLLPGGRREEQVVLLWTDGEDLERGAQGAGQELAGSGVRVFAVGIGTSSGDIVPVLDDQGRAIDVKRDENGGPVRSRLDENLLRSLARRTRGSYFSASRPGGELPRLLGALGTLARSGHGTRLAERPVARFPLFAGVAALLIAIDLGRSRRRVAASRTGLAAARERAARTAAAAATLWLAALLPSPVQAQSAWARGDRAFKRGDWAGAESLYTLRLRHGGPAAPRVNLATAQARAGHADQADLELGQLATHDDFAGRAAGYNLGTLLGERNQDAEALKELRRSLERDPDDADARWNYELVLRREEQKKHGGVSAPKPESQEPQGDSGPGKPQPNTGGKPQAGPSGQQKLPAPSAPQPSVNRNNPNAGSARTMDRGQAERLLGSLEDLERAEQQRLRKAKVVREKHGKDW